MTLSIRLCSFAKFGQFFFGREGGGGKSKAKKKKKNNKKNVACIICMFTWKAHWFVSHAHAWASWAKTIKDSTSANAISQTTLWWQSSTIPSSWLRQSSVQADTSYNKDDLLNFFATIGSLYCKKRFKIEQFLLFFAKKQKKVNNNKKLSKK